MLMAIPSKGRAGQTRSDKVITSATMFVPETEVDSYRLTVDCKKVVGIPNEIIGITKTRNWILDWATARNERWVVFIDDDVKVHGWIEMLGTRGKHHDLTEPEWVAAWIRLFEVTEGLGWHLWGVDTLGQLRSVYPFRPFIFRTYVTASCMGMINDGIRFDERFLVKEDYELCLRCVMQDGGVVGARFLYWANDHWTKEGGCHSYRTRPVEEEAIELLQELYPDMVRRTVQGGSDLSIKLVF